MYLSLILFFLSLVGIVILIGKKSFALRKAQIDSVNEFEFEIPDIEDIKYVAVKKLKRFGYIALVVSIRGYIRSYDFLKKRGRDMVENVKDKLKKKREAGEAQEVSKFLKMISEYKQKIRKIKHRIREEEKNK